jgi:hypothetical protein
MKNHKQGSYEWRDFHLYDIAPNASAGIARMQQYRPPSHHRIAAVAMECAEM